MKTEEKIALSWEKLHGYIEKPVFRESANGYKGWIIVKQLVYDSRGFIVVDELDDEHFCSCNLFYREEVK